MNTKRFILPLVIFCVIFTGTVSAQNQTERATKRMGLFIGSNSGGSGRVTLRYAVSDARAVARVFGEMGGISHTDNFLLEEPSVAEINRRLDSIAAELAAAKRNSQRTELVFYYSGHSDEEALLLNSERYGYRELRERINGINTDMRIVILDSCSSGAITRAKGGVKTMPFLFDNSVSVEGYAFLTSSSAEEASQESDSIESSYFTHSILAGLRGAADTVGDGRVTLNELYRFAYAETLAKTETSVYGAQHPSYDMQVSGSGDVILTDINETSAALVIDPELTGRISIRDSSDFLVAELTKVNSSPMELGLEPGLYRITLQRGNNFYRAEVILEENKHTPLAFVNFSQITSASGNRTRGEDDASEDTPLYPVNIQLVPFWDLTGHSFEKATNNFLFGPFLVFGHNLEGIGFGGIGLVNSGYVSGLQLSGVFNTAAGNVEGAQVTGVFNIAGGNVEGAQVSGVFNTAAGNVEGAQVTGVFNIAGGNVEGAQVSGVFNYASGGLTGVQASVVNIIAGESGGGLQLGVVNVSRSEDTLPVGLVNVVKGGIMHPSIYVDDMMFLNAAFRSGSKHFYGHLGAGAGGGLLPGMSGDRLLVYRAGFGFEIPAGKFFIDIDLSSGRILNLDEIEGRVSGTINDWHSVFSNAATEIYQLRLSAGCKIFEHLGIFAGVSYDYLRAENAENFTRDFDSFIFGKTYGRHAHKLGFFGGIQF